MLTIKGAFLESFEDGFYRETRTEGMVMVNLVELHAEDGRLRERRMFITLERGLYLSLLLYFVDENLSKEGVLVFKDPYIFREKQCVPKVECWLTTSMFEYNICTN